MQGIVVEPARCGRVTDAPESEDDHRATAHLAEQRLDSGAPVTRLKEKVTRIFGDVGAVLLPLNALGCRTVRCGLPSRFHPPVVEVAPVIQKKGRYRESG